MLITNFMTIFYSKDRAAERVYGRTSIKFSLNNLLVITALAGLLVFSGCEEDPSQIGVGILPGSDLNTLVSSDTFNISTYTSYFDKIESYSVDSSGSVSKPAYQYLGCDYSPYFGLTQAGFVSQMWLGEEWPKDHATLDSLILYLHFSSVTGETPPGEDINIYEIDKYLSGDSTYYINDNVPIKQYLTSFNVGGLLDQDTVVQVKMPMTFIDELMRDTTQLFLSETEDDFRKYFKGLYFEYPQTVDYHMSKVNLNGGFSYFRLYYTDTASTVSNFTFLFNSKTVSYNVFEHDFDAADPLKMIEHINEEIQDTVSYIQGYNGVYTTLGIPGLVSLRDSMPIAVNKARLYLPAYSNETDFLEEILPAQLIARYVDESGDRYVTRDYEIDPALSDGQYYSLDDYYIINITAFVQDYLEGIITEPEIEIVFASYEGSHLILWAEGSANAPKLELVYTKL